MNLSKGQVIAWTYQVMTTRVRLTGSGACAGSWHQLSFVAEMEQLLHSCKKRKNALMQAWGKFSLRKIASFWALGLPAQRKFTKQVPENVPGNWKIRTLQDAKRRGLKICCYNFLLSLNSPSLWAVNYPFSVFLSFLWNITTSLPHLTFFLLQWVPPVFSSREELVVLL